MEGNKNFWVSTLSYFLVGTFSLVVAFFLSTQFIIPLLADSSPVSLKNRKNVSLKKEIPKKVTQIEREIPRVASGESSTSKSSTVPLEKAIAQSAMLANAKLQSEEPILVAQNTPPPQPVATPPTSAQAPTAASPQNGEASNALGEEPVALSSDTDGLFDVNILKQFLRQYEYSPEGQRDPFAPFVIDGAAAPVVKKKAALTPLQRFDLDQLKLMGIIWGVRKPQAMMKDPTGRIHIVKKDSKVGRNDGYVAVIREGELVIVESFEESGQVSYQTRIMKITK